MGYEPFLAVLVIVVAIIAPFLAAGALLTYSALAKQARGRERVYDVIIYEKDYVRNEWRVRVKSRSLAPDPKPGDVVLLLHGAYIQRFEVRAVTHWDGTLVLRGSYLGN